MSIKTRVDSGLRKHPALRLLASTAAHPTNRGKRVQSIARVSRYLSTGRPTRVPVGSHSFMLAYPGETNSQHAVAKNPPNYPEMYVWSRYLRPGDLFVDVGANVGIYTIWALDCGADVIAVEPVANNAARVRENVELNGYQAEVVEKALTDAPGIVTFTTERDSYNHIVTDGGPDDGATTEVEATTLDDLLDGRTACVKIDVEGAEHMVLDGAKQSLADRRIPLIQIEWFVKDETGVSYRIGPLDILRDAGYQIYASDKHGVLSPVDEPPTTSVNVFAMPAD